MSPVPLHSFLQGTEVGHDACGTGFMADRAGRSRADILPLALTALSRLDHRGAVGGDGETGDGAGVLTAIPWSLLLAEPGLGLTAAMEKQGFGVGSIFLPLGAEGRALGVGIVEEGLKRCGLTTVAWREVPTRDEVLGCVGSTSRPGLAQVIVARPGGVEDEPFRQRLFGARRQIEAAARARGLADLYVASLCHRTIVYKALLRGAQLRHFYADLTNPLFTTSFAVFHNRFSTNTDPSWPRTQPFRHLAHNGEINTIDGNRLWMEARRQQGAAHVLGLGVEASTPLLARNESDSASLDEAFRLLTAAGHPPLEALSILIPPAWENNDRMPPRVRAFYERAAQMMEPWDGPALIAFADGRVVGAMLDRNGLRPARSVVTTDHLVMVASETGVLDVADERIADRGFLGPGGILAVDLQSGAIIDRPSLERILAASPLAAPSIVLGIEEAEGASQETPRTTELAALAAFGYTREEIQFVIAPMARDGAEPIGSMGDDIPLACLSEKPRLLSSFFKQRFAQVTNPPIDPLREHLVMSLRTSLGPSADVFSRTAVPGETMELSSPILSERNLEVIENYPDEATSGVSLLFAVLSLSPEEEMERALGRVVLAAVADVRQGATRLVLSDRGVDINHAAIPALLAVGAVHQRLVREGLRLRASLIVETGEARDDHQVAILLGYGANAVCPYGAFDAARRAPQGAEQPCSPDAAVSNMKSTLEKGLLKILSKMGIATVRSYQGAQLFEAIGLDRKLVDLAFTGTPSQLEGHGLLEIARDVLDRHARAFQASFAELEEGGVHRYRRNGEAHAFEPPVVKALHALIKSGERLDARRYAQMIEERAPLAVRDLLRFQEAASPLSPDEVEPVESIMERFSTAAMSLGSLSPEAHEALAIAMNRTGGRSNSGEGGEPEANYWRELEGGDRPNHRIKQVASARFGVTTDYLVAAEELQIKIAQGSKPGEGGQLPGRKVVAHIARVRHSPEGVTLISPPPHHDIYSIEDLAQLVHDLKRVNPKATVSVKLVSAAGIGAIAAGVVKAGADTIAIGGHDGGTGASPLSSIKNAGTPWEFGLLEVHRTLVNQGLRGRVRLGVEGGLKTGRDVVIAAAMGADEFAFGSAALVAAGCVMARQCHLNTCPAGIATQRDDLRLRFRSAPDQAVSFMTAVAEEAREILASLGLRSLREVVGDSSVLQPRELSGKGRSARVSAASLLGRGAGFLPTPSREAGARNEEAIVPGLDERVLSRLRVVHGEVEPLTFSSPIANADRSVGARVAGELARVRRGLRLPEGTVNLRFQGTAGQSFGAFAVDGMSLTLEGDANDYVGKGLSGGEIVLRPRRDGKSRTDNQAIAGNTILYGATRGHLFAAGRVGERFAVRLSGAVAVVEGTGDHACEYMTAGTVLILGSVGRNFGAGMSGGLAYVYDPHTLLKGQLNGKMVGIEESLSPEDEGWLKEACRRHWEATASPRVEGLFQDWPSAIAALRRVTPKGLPSVRPTAWRTTAPETRIDADRLWSVA